MMNLLRNPRVWALTLAAGVLTVSISAQAPQQGPGAPPPSTPQQPNTPPNEGRPGAPPPSTPVQPPVDQPQAQPAAPTPAQPRAVPPSAPPPGIPQTTPAPASQLPQFATPRGPSQTERYVVGQAVPVPPSGGTLMNLTLEQAIEIALERNLELKVARMNPPGVDYQMASARAAFNPQFTGTYRYNNQGQISTDNLDKVSSFNTKGQTMNMSMSQTLHWTGGSLNAQFNNGRQVSTNPRSPYNPQLTTALAVTFTQPLLAGFSIDNNRNQLRTLSIQRQIADIQLLTTIENTKASVRTAYWNLRQAIEQIEIQRRSLDLSQRLFQDNRTKVEIGTLAPIETTTSETAVANAEQQLLNAQISWTSAELTLKRLLAASPEDDLYNATLNPVEQAALSVQSVDIKGAVQRALEQRTDIMQAKRTLDVSRLNLEVTQNLTRPQLNLQTGYSGSGANSKLTNGDVTGYGTAFSQLGSFEVPTWNVQFNFTYPLFMAAARANFARAQLAIDQSQASLKAQELTVTADVTNAGLAVENTFKQLQAAQKAREVAERNAEAEQTRFDVGMSTNYNVVQAQNNLTTQRLTELRALINYLNSVAEFDRIQRVGR
ncbi:MAG: TolC family protein [Vicinamibacterales bacterium]